MNDNTMLYIVVFLFSFISTLLIGKIIIPLLNKNAAQPIYEDGPVWHMTKSGTPTMGGLSFLVTITVTLLLCSLYKYLADDKTGSLSLLLCAVYSLLNALIGIVDDTTKLRHKHNAGLTPSAKLILQFICTTLFLTARSLLLGDDTAVTFSFGSLELGLFYYPIVAIVLVGLTNCANLTDGVDGISSSVAFAIGISAFYFAYGHYDGLAFISAALVGAAIGFLIFNVHPAKVFMGDTGSLYLGALISSAFFELDNPLFGIVSGGIYVIEGLSVILQVVFFKLCKKRLFKMAPIHHHFEKCGWDENKICLCAIIITLLMSIPVYLCVR